MLALTPWWTASAQGQRTDVRWRLVDRDTIAEVPYAVMLDWATYRTVDRQRLREAAVRLVTAQGLIQSQQHELDVLRTAMQAQAADIAALRSSLTVERDGSKEERDRADRQKAWAMIGKVSVAVMGAGVIGGVYLATTRAAR